MQKHVLPFLLLALSANAQPCRLLKDIHVGNLQNSKIVFATQLTVAGDRLFFSGAECTQSPEVYAVDTSTDSIYLPKNVWSESGFSWCGTDPVYYFNSASNLSSLGSFLFYTIYHDDFGRELWRTDGTFDGTLLVGDIFPGKANSNPDNLTSFKNKIWFSATNATHGRELWYSDGSLAGTQMLADLSQGVENSDPDNLTASNDFLYFTAKLPGQDYWLWKTDGTAVGTVPITSLSITGMQSVEPVFLQAIGDEVYWALRDNTIKTAFLLRLDLQNMQPILLASFQTLNSSYAQSPSPLTESAGNLYFSSHTDSTGRELWVTDGTPDGTKLVSDFLPGADGSSPVDFISFNDTLYFRARPNNTYQLCKSDGTEAGTFSLNVPAQPTYGANSDLIEWNGYLWFASGGWEIWRSDGTEVGSDMIFGDFVYNSINSMVVFGNALYFLGGRGDTISVWKSDGVPGNQPQALKGNDPAAKSSGNSNFARMRERAYFWATSGDDERQLWTSNGNESGTFPVTNLEITTNGTSAAPLVLNDSLLIFYSFTWPTGNELWRSDGNLGSETMIMDLIPGEEGSLSMFGRSDGRYAYFIGGDGWSNDLYRTDGSEAGTILLKLGISGFGPLINYDGNAYFKVFFQGDTWLLRTDGTPVGTVIITKIEEGHVYTIPENLAVFDSLLYFLKQNDDGSWGLWKTDGSVGGTAMAAKLNPPGIGSPSSLTAVGDRLFFRASDGVLGYELWISDGTQDGTQLLKDLTPGANTTTIYSMKDLGGNLLFTLRDSIHGIELWSSDGTPDGTHLLKDILPGGASSYPRIDFSMDSLLFFTAFTENFGRELWQTDGTAEGTFMVQDVCQGPCSSSPRNLYPFPANRLFFTAYSPEWGIEPWIYDPLNTSSVKPTSEVFEGKSFVVFPNPVHHNVVNLAWKENVPPSTAQVFDLHGRMLAFRIVETVQNPSTLYLPDLPSGLYFVKISDKNGWTIGVEKLLVQKN